jgi:hypothetical protein
VIDVIDEIIHGVQSLAACWATGRHEVAVVYSNRKRIKPVAANFRLNGLEKFGFTQGCPEAGGNGRAEYHG